MDFSNIFDFTVKSRPTKDSSDDLHLQYLTGIHNKHKSE